MSVLSFGEEKKKLTRSQNFLLGLRCNNNWQLLALLATQRYPKNWKEFHEAWIELISYRLIYPIGNFLSASWFFLFLYYFSGLSNTSRLKRKTKYFFILNILWKLESFVLCPSLEKKITEQEINKNHIYF